NHGLPRDFNFHACVLRALEKDFISMVGTTWYIWLSVVAIILVSSYVWDDSIIITVLGFL
ncbi:unnamed protein product, partial [Closterium sp. NIES-54]